MTIGERTAETLLEIMAREIARNPHAGEIIGAFQPLLLARKRFLAAEKWQPMDLTGFDPHRFGAGVALLQQLQFFSPDDPWEEMAAALTAAIKEGFPLLCRDMERIAAAVASGDWVLPDYLRSLSDVNGAGKDDEEDDRIVSRASGLSVAVPPLMLFLQQLMRIVLEKRLPEVLALMGNVEWQHGYCPVCGSFPTIALIEEKITRRWLHCSRCGHDWLFSRVICPYCEQESQQGMDFFYLEDRKQEAAFTCDRCRRYLVTLKGVSDLHDHDLDISAMSLAHLDVIMQGRGYLPMMNCPWNAFPG